jgi:hypothetical protein
VNNDEQTQQADDPSGPGWRDVASGEILHVDDMVQRDNGWGRTRSAGTPAGYQRYRRRIEQQRASDSEPETMQQLREQVQTFRNLAEMSRRQVADEAQKIEQLKEQVATLTRERDRYRNQLSGAIEHSSAAAARQQVLEALQTWLRPVLELVAEHPEDCGPLAVSVLGYLPGIASRLIEE